MSSLRERLRAEAELLLVDGDRAVESVLRRGRRRRVARMALTAAGSLVLVFVMLAIVVSFTDRERNARPVGDPLGANTKCGPALEYARAYGPVERWVAGETLTLREWFEHEKKQAGPGGPYPGVDDPNDPGLSQVITRCIYDGDFHNFAKGPPTGPDRKPRDVRYTRISIEVADGTADFHAIAPFPMRDRLLPPAAWEEARHGRPLPSPSP